MSPIRPPTIINGKTTLLKLINYYGVSMISLAHQSRIEVREVHKMVKGEEVEREVAEKVLVSLSRAAGIKYTLREVHINIKRGN